MIVAEHYWKEFYRLKVHITYLEQQLATTEKMDRGVKMFLAVTSSASIGAWAVWRELGPLWATLIAGSQVVNAIRQYLPYQERLRSISGLVHELEEILLGVESKWLEISAGDLSEPQIHKALADMRAKRQRAFKKHFPNKLLPDDAATLATAEAKTNAYFDNFYS